MSDTINPTVREKDLKIADLEAKIKKQAERAAEQIELRDLHIDGLCETVRSQQEQIKELEEREAAYEETVSHQSSRIAELEAENAKLKEEADYWRPKTPPPKGERGGVFPPVTKRGKKA